MTQHLAASNCLVPCYKSSQQQALRAIRAPNRTTSHHKSAHAGFNQKFPDGKPALPPRAHSRKQPFTSSRTRPFLPVMTLHSASGLPWIRNLQENRFDLIFHPLDNRPTATDAATPCITPTGLSPLTNPLIRTDVTEIPSRTRHRLARIVASRNTLPGRASLPQARKQSYRC